MKISVSMYSLHKVVNKENWTVLDFIDYAKSISLDGVELLDIYWKDKEAEIEQVKRVLEDEQMIVSAYDVTNNFVKETAEERKQQGEKVLDGIRVAKQLGTDVVRVFCGDLNGELTYKDGQNWIVEGLKACATLAEEEKIYLAIENHGLLAGKSEQVEEIIQKVNSPYVKSTFDTGNFLLVHEEPTKAFERLKDKIVHVHFKDFRKKRKDENIPAFLSVKEEELIGTVPGDGQVDLDYIVKGLKNANYGGFLSVEYEGPDDPKTSTAEAVKRLRDLREA
ncbi:sugar phosphate isomerase/epimerase family protein [Oceanobacillus bengalensis]|uniref:Sugar phosphate isomerase/epimerase n=1 Tax=Oceanobacillus bengalensis TaxID=1435466 RepID=A0A494YZL9_9BACI|nr:sugar phosphate isomerase/epimerase [Oceanobacillus bengalensis]RKQ15691.1 sugar phosphate isomerase/epimerase [Oceanobacillus bengalensis]